MQAWTAVLMVAILAAAAAPGIAGDGDAILGLWATEPDDEDGNAHVEIFEQDGTYHGRIVWLEKPVYGDDDEQGMAGQPKVDRENADPALRSRPILGLPIVAGFVFDGRGWHKGTIYDPDNGKTYRCKAQLGDHGELRVRGFVGVSLLGRTTTWTRVTP